ncbi:hypothetical protein PM082_014802 [Marasmius tenuissimus]|nr:hypothetical protein PM082_014802 [Marasmius tenuissimus]
MQWGCWDVEMWLDPSRGVICHGPKGPFSHLPADSLDIKDLPPTAELLQEDVLMRFLASHKSKEADDVFFDALYLASDDEDMPEQADRPTIFSALSKTPIAVANNVWEGWEDNLVDRTCLENGLTRFRLDGDGELRLTLNSDVREAWLWQAGSVLHARGVLLEDAQGRYTLVFPEAWSGGYLENSPSKCQRRRQQPVYFFVYPPPPNLEEGKTSSLHHWSFHQDSHSQLSPELCCDLGLPVELNLRYGGYSSCSWPTSIYQLINQYQLLRGFNPMTTDFARHFGYDRNIFQPLDDDDRTHLKDASDIQDLGPVTNSSSPVDLEIIGDDFAAGSQHDVANKRQRTDTSVGRVQTRTHPYQDLYRGNSTTVNEQASGDVALRPIRPLPRRTHPSSLKYSSENRWRVVSHGDTAFGSQKTPSRPFYRYPRISPRSESLPSPIITLAPPYHLHPAACFRMPQNTATRSFDSSPPFDSYFSHDNDSNTTLNSAYTDPSTYLVDVTSTTSFTSDDRTPERVEWPGLAQDMPSTAVNTFLHDPPFYPILADTYPSHAADRAHLPFSPHGSGYSYGGGFISPQYDWNTSVSHSSSSSTRSSPNRE